MGSPASQMFRVPFSLRTLLAELQPLLESGIKSAVFSEGRWANAVRNSGRCPMVVRSLDEWLDLELQQLGSRHRCLAPYDSWAVTLARSVVSRSDPLPPWEGSWCYLGFRRRLVRLLLELWDAGWTSAHLHQLTLANEGRIADKCSSLAALLQRVESIFLRENRVSRTHAVASLLESNHLNYAELAFFVSGDVLEWQRRLLGHIKEQATGVLVGEGFADYPEAFAESDTLLDGATTRGARANVTLSDLTGIDPYEEVESVLIALSQCDREGTQSALFSVDPQAYGPLVVAAGARLGIPVHVSLRDQLMLVPLVRDWFFGLEALILSGQDSFSAGDSELDPDLLMVWKQPSHVASAQAWHLNSVTLWDLCVISRRVADGRTAMAIKAMFEAAAQLSQTADEDDLLSATAWVAAWKSLVSESEFTYTSGSNGIRLTSDSADIGDVKNLAILGMADGSYPGRRSENPLLNDDERRELNRQSSRATAIRTSFDIQSAVEDDLYRVLSAASERTILCFAENRLEGENVPAQFLLQWRAQQEHHNPKVSTMRSNLLNPGVLGASLQDAISQPGIERTTDLLPLDDQPIVSLATNESIRPRDIQDILQCPFRFGASSRLGLRPAWNALRAPRLSSIPRLAGLAQARTLDEAKVLLKSAFESELDQIASMLTADELVLARTWASRLIREWVEQEFAAREQWQRLEPTVPVYVERDVSKALGMPEDSVKLSFRSEQNDDTQGYRLAKVYGVSKGMVKETKFDVESPIGAFVAAHLVALRHEGLVPGVEFVTTQGDRVVVAMATSPNATLIAKGKEGRNVVWLEKRQDRILQRFRDILELAVSKLRANDMAILPSKESCSFCSLSELCRKDAFASAEGVGGTE